MFSNFLGKQRTLFPSPVSAPNTLSYVCSPPLNSRFYPLVLVLFLPASLAGTHSPKTSPVSVLFQFIDVGDGHVSGYVSVCVQNEQSRGFVERKAWIMEPRNTPQCKCPDLSEPWFPCLENETLRPLWVKWNEDAHTKQVPRITLVKRNMD